MILNSKSLKKIDTFLQDEKIYPIKLVSYTNQNRLFQCFLEWYSVTNACPRNIVHTSQKMEFSIKEFCNKCDQICSFLRIWPHLLEKSFMENLIFCPVVGLPRQISATGNFEVPWDLNIFVILPFSKCGTESCPPPKKGEGWYCVGFPTKVWGKGGQSTPSGCNKKH